jgi:radical SAM protein with 4Fe4S-binding SPASM domain
MNLHTISFNFPSINIEQWSILMGLPKKLFTSTKKAIELSIRKLGNMSEVNIIVQSAYLDQVDRIKEIKEHFSKYGEVSVVEGFCRSRAGEVKNNHVICVNYEDGTKFSGCDRVVSHLHVSWEGECYLCCEDYHQKFKLGNLLKKVVMSVMKSDFVNQLRAEIYGLFPMRKDLICRKCPKIRK